MQFLTIFKIVIMMRCSLRGVIGLIYFIKYFIVHIRGSSFGIFFSLQLEGVKGLIIRACKHSIQLRVLNLVFFSKKKSNRRETEGGGGERKSERVRKCVSGKRRTPKAFEDQEAPSPRAGAILI